MKYKSKRKDEWVLIYDEDNCVLRMNSWDFESNESMEKYLLEILNRLNQNKDESKIL